MNVEQQYRKTFRTSRIRISPPPTPQPEHVPIKFPKLILPSAKSVLTSTLWFLVAMIQLEPTLAVVGHHVQELVEVQWLETMRQMV